MADLDEGAGHRQVRPAHIGADMEQADHALAAMLAGDERRAVLQRGPALGCEHGVGLGQHLAVDGDILRHNETRERTIGGERGHVLRLLPGQAAAERASAAAQLDGNEVVIGLREPGPGETHQHAALLDPGVEPVADFRRQRADIGHHDHRQPLIEELPDHLLRRAAIAEPDVGEWRQRAGEIEGRRQQRLRGVAARARHDADGAAAVWGRVA